MNWRRGRVILLLLTITVVLAGWWGMSRRVPEIRFTAAGAQFELLAIKHGSIRDCPLPHAWERHAATIPGFIRDKLPKSGWPTNLPPSNYPGFTRSSQHPALGLWFQVDGKAGLGSNMLQIGGPAVRAPMPVMVWSLEDEQGRVAWCSHLGRVPRRGAGPGQFGYAVFFDGWPRDSRKLRLRAWSHQNGLQPVAEVLMPTPQGSRWHRSQNPAASLPQTVRVNKLEFTLKAFELSGHKPGGEPAWMLAHALPAVSAAPYCRLLTAVLQDGEPRPEWRPVSLTLSDEDGNRVPSTPGLGFGTLIRDQTIWTRPAPWPGNVWRVEVEFARRSQFAPEEMVSAMTVPLPVFTSPGFSGRGFGSSELPSFGLRPSSSLSHPASLSISNRHEGITLSLKSVQPMVASRDGLPTEWELCVALNPFPEDTHLTLVRVADDHDQHLPHHSLVERTPAGELLFRFHAPRATPYVNVSFALHHSLKAVFHAAPSDALLAGR